MSSLLPFLLSWLIESGYPVLWILVFVAAAGLPLPMNLVLLAGGAFALFGNFNIFILLGIAISASVCGDSLGYWIGRRWGSRLLDRIERSGWRRFFPQHSVIESRIYFKRHGAWAIFLSRFLVTALGGTINIIAGTEVYPYRLFLVFDISGEILGAAIPLSLGYIFGVSWEAVGDILGAFSGFVLTFILVILFSISLIRMIRNAQKMGNETAKGTLERKNRSANLQTIANITRQLLP